MGYFDDPCRCGHLSMNHVYFLSPWWKFWKTDYKLGECYNKECRDKHNVMTQFVNTACLQFKFDTLKYIEQLYDKRISL